ncbi:MAG: hypothetical protein Q8N17_17865 [Burkholderiaceae bacterium]|nr:hypothetical protein [Burkholderiaceae bacterium]
MDLPTNEPTVIRAGDSVAWTRELAEYSAADGWALKYRLLYATGTAVDITSTAVATLHTVSLTAANTGAYAAGSATLVAYVEKGAGASLERATLESSAITILPNLITAATHDGRSANRIALANARAALASYMAKGQAHVAEYDIAGRRMKFRAATEITDLINYYEREVFRETAALAAINGVAAGRIAVRM